MAVGDEDGKQDGRVEVRNGMLSVGRWGKTEWIFSLQKMVMFVN